MQMTTRSIIWLLVIMKQLRIIFICAKRRNIEKQYEAWAEELSICTDTCRIQLDYSLALALGG